MPPGRLTKSGCRQSNAIASWVATEYQQPKLAGNIYHHGQRELRYGNTYTHSYRYTNSYPYTNSNATPTLNSRRTTSIARMGDSV